MDYSAANGEWSFGHMQQRERCITISTSRDNFLEKTEEFFVDLNSTSVGVELTIATSSVFITDNNGMLHLVLHGFWVAIREILPFALQAFWLNLKVAHTQQVKMVMLLKYAFQCHVV